ncbi:dihydroneopterin aldolase [Geofilum sp. OHC36d9]|uniref:dihydroneopterin aldolase n=1 Tax=Geofilum sp. OHC36d9 TaxID=3458413 RepID=UPI0040334B38
MAVIFIRDLLLRTEVGFNPHELGKKQDVLLNIAIHYGLRGEEISDSPDDALNYKTLCKGIVRLVEDGHFNLLERLVNNVADYLLLNERILKVEVTADKPHALRFARSVAFSLEKKREIV